MSYKDNRVNYFGYRDNVTRDEYCNLKLINKQSTILLCI